MGFPPGGRFEEAAGEARRCARAVAERRGLEIVEPLGPEQQRDAVQLLARVWKLPSPDSLITAPLLRVLEHSGNYVAGAYRDGELIGAATALFGRGHLHSDLLGVAPEHQGSGVGFALKQHQRAWALSCGLDEIRWTFDPLLPTNAYFNMHKLGAQAVKYLPHFYDISDESDRLYVRWHLCSRPATAAASAGIAGTRPSGPAPIPPPDLPVDKADILLDRLDGAPLPDLSPSRSLPSGGPLLVALPDRDDPAPAPQWRPALRDALTTAFAAGYKIVDVSPANFYVLAVGPGPEHS